MTPIGVFFTFGVFLVPAPDTQLGAQKPTQLTSLFPQRV
jgi:hypothetical protein